jgi:hypothetical protein
MLFLATLTSVPQDEGLLGALGLFAGLCIGVVGWIDKRVRDMDGRVRDVEKETATNTATIQQIDKNVTRLLDIAENGHARN